MRPVATLRSAALWSLLDRVARQALQFVIGIILARLLSPADYGLVGMLAIFIAIANVLANGGLGLALIQRKDLTQADETSAFYLNVVAGIVLTAALYALAPLIADFYDQPILRDMAWVASFQVLLTAFGVVQGALLTRAMDFRTQAMVSLLVTGASGVIGIGLALHGAGVWSLVVQGLLACGLNTLLLWIVSPWRPRGRPAWARLRDLAGFSANSLGSGLLYVGFDSLYPAVIGKLYSPASLGFFTRANQLQQLPAMIVTDVVGRVAFPHFSTMQSDVPRLKDELRRLSRIVGAVHFPVMVGLAATAATLIPWLLMDKWRGAVPLLEVLCFAGLLYPLNALHVSAMNAQGKAALVLRLELIKKGILLAIVLGTFRFGVLAMVWGMVTHYVACSALNLVSIHRGLGYRTREFLADVLPYLATSGTCGAAAVAVGRTVSGPSPLVLALQVGAGAAVYLAIAWVLRGSVYRDAWGAFSALVDVARDSRSDSNA